MGPDVDILMWDDSRERINHVRQRYPQYCVEASTTTNDFAEQLEQEPKLVILNTQYQENIILNILDQGLTKDGFVITFATEKYRKHIVPKLEALSISTVGFDINNQYLWVSIYNIITPNTEDYHDNYFDCEVPEDFF